MSLYEVTYLTEDEQGLDATAIAPHLGAIGATIKEVAPWGGRRRLAYPINRIDQAFYTTVVFEADPAGLHELTNLLNRDHAGIIRSLVVAYQPKKTSERVRAAEGGASKMNRKASSQSPEAATGTDEAKPTEAPVEAKPVEAAEAAEVSAEAPESKPEKKPRRKAATPTPDLDEKLKELLNEDISS